MAAFALQDGEVVLAEIRPSVLASLWRECYTFGLFEIVRRRRRCILTTQRLVLIRGVLSRSVRMIPLDRIQDISVDNTLWVARLCVSSAGGSLGVEELRPLRTSDARKFAASVSLQIAARRGTQWA